MTSSKDRLKNPLETRLGYQIRRASMAMMASLARRLGETGVTAAEASILILVASNPGVTQTDIARSLAIKRANMVPLVNGLMARGLLEREPADGRSHALHLTKAGAQAARQAQRQMQAHDTQFFGGLSEAERRKLSGLLSGIWDESEG
jgi:DNA-binding MarR family transcriptional regulator